MYRYLLFLLIAVGCVWFAGHTLRWVLCQLSLEVVRLHPPPKTHSSPPLLGAVLRSCVTHPPPSSPGYAEQIVERLLEVVNLLFLIYISKNMIEYVWFRKHVKVVTILRRKKTHIQIYIFIYLYFFKSSQQPNIEQSASRL